MASGRDPETLGGPGHFLKPGNFCVCLCTAVLFQGVPLPLGICFSWVVKSASSGLAELKEEGGGSPEMWLLMGHLLEGRPSRRDLCLGGFPS